MAAFRYYSRTVLALPVRGVPRTLSVYGEGGVPSARRVRWRSTRVLNIFRQKPIMTLKTISIDRKSEGYIVITLNRPDKLNALNIRLLDELREVFTDLARDDSRRGVIITGSGEKAFAAGADIAELNRLDG